MGEEQVPELPPLSERPLLKIRPVIPTTTVCRKSCILRFFGEILDFIMAPLTVAGMVQATPKRLAVSWGIVIGVTLIVIVIMRMPSPWRNFIDIGVVLGLGWGAVSMLCWTIGVGCY